jgi:nucleoside-diphosphate-sugar epimerase
VVLPSEREHPVVQQYAGKPAVRFVFGDLTDYPFVESCVRGVDYVLHTAAVVSPFADDHPELAHRVNVGAARNIVRAVRQQSDPDAIGVVMVGSVAETGDRNPPHHWGRVGDPVRVAQFDEYGQTKVIAERLLVDSGLSRWAWLRQTGIFYPDLLQIRDPIITHTPLGGVMEWVSVDDAARLMVNICEDGVPAQFWGGIYNVGGGEPWRLTNWQLQTALADALGVRDVRRWYERNWFATRNFHGHWYTDSDRLEQLVPFREDSFTRALNAAARSARGNVRWAGRVPPWIVKRFVIAPLTRKARGTMAFIRDNDIDKIRAYFGSKEEWERVGGWDTFVPPEPDRTPHYLEHGYDESKQPESWTAMDLRDAADFRGGQLVSAHVNRGDISTQLRWRCALHHEFPASPRLILIGGHWCPACVRDSAGYGRQARANRFLAQVQPPTDEYA